MICLFFSKKKHYFARFVIFNNFHLKILTKEWSFLNPCTLTWLLSRHSIFISLSVFGLYHIFLHQIIHIFMIQISPSHYGPNKASHTHYCRNNQLPRKILSSLLIIYTLTRSLCLITSLIHNCSRRLIAHTFFYDSSSGNVYMFLAKQIVHLIVWFEELIHTMVNGKGFLDINNDGEIWWFFNVQCLLWP